MSTSPSQPHHPDAESRRAIVTRGLTRPAPRAPGFDLPDVVPEGATIVDHPTARTLEDWLTIQREEYADYESGIVASPMSGRILLWRRAPQPGSGA